MSNGADDFNENSNDNNDTNNKSPTTALTFQKLHDMLHRAIADQALLWDVLEHCCSNRPTAPTTTAATMAQWERFPINLHLSATARCLPLTLSRLSGWIDRLGGCLSFILSVHFGGGNAATPPPSGLAPALA